MGNLLKARVYRSSKREYDCKIIDNKQLVKAKALGNLLKQGEIVVGDFVGLAGPNLHGEYIIEKIFERQNEIYRVIVRERKKKVTAANCDFLIIVSSVSKPAFKRGIIDRFLVRAHNWDITPLVIFNKMDEYQSLFIKEKVDICFEQERLNLLGAQAFEITATHENYTPQFLKRGISELKQCLKGKTALFVGQSGVGKSHLISTLTEGKVSLKGRQIGKKSGKGSHTTTWSEIIDAGDFTLIDSPGIRSFSIEDLTKEDLKDAFWDIAEISSQCAFTDCKHLEESKDCAFKKIDSKAILSRLDSYKRFYEEITSLKEWQKKM